MSNKIFGILNLSSRTIHTNDKGEIFKKFTPFLPHIKPFDVKTKKKTLSDVFCTVSISDKIVLEYHENISPDNIPLILTKLEWRNCLKKEQIDEIINIDLTPNRINLQTLSYTIDPEGSLDRDDAIGIDIINKKIYISIADPSSYISKDSIFDKELNNRVQSIYLDKVYHMFPEPLSTNIISLTEGNISRAFTLELSYDNSYEIISHKFYKSNIQVKNLTYEQAEVMISNKSNQDILELYNFGLNQLKHDIQKDLYDSHKMVEVFMILCNKFAAIEMKDCKSIIRYNNTPKLDLTHFSSEEINAKLLEMYKISNNEAATYEINTEFNGHSLLNLEHYTHFSSPLRRYIDLVLHRILYAKINNQNNFKEIYSEEEIKNICLNVNNINKIYKFAYNIDKLNKLLKDKNSLELDCDLIYFNNSLIKLYYCDNNKDLLLFVNLIHSKIKENIDINQNKFDELIITSSLNNVIKLKLFQKVKIKIFKLKNNIKTYQISLIDPVLELI